MDTVYTDVVTIWLLELVAYFARVACIRWKLKNALGQIATAAKPAILYLVCRAESECVLYGALTAKCIVIASLSTLSYHEISFMCAQKLCDERTEMEEHAIVN